MKRVSGFLLVVVLAGASALYQPALAQGFNIRKNGLPDGSQVERSRLRVQIVDPSPIVTDTRHQEDTTTYQINVSPLKPGKNTVVQIGDGGGNNGGASSVPIHSNGLPTANFSTNIPAGGTGPGRALPPGKSSNGLGQVAARKMPGLSSGQNPSTSQAGIVSPQSQEVKMYDKTGPATVVTANRHSVETVKAQLHRGDLVHK